MNYWLLSFSLSLPLCVSIIFPLRFSYQSGFCHLYFSLLHVFSMFYTFQSSSNIKHAVNMESAFIVYGCTLARINISININSIELNDIKRKITINAHIPDWMNINDVTKRFSSFPKQQNGSHIYDENLNLTRWMCVKVPSKNWKIWT